ncbi:ATP synthase subunit I [Geobacter hydrogenophilus]|uniref:ATP synthase subunit I n=1 Tax=Geobacter hydrogenophilus TaxID=40983 RepID=A0A9W6FZY3_9BACT|nr:ATP synthase subunit I [Geobacter hydrogenophilus]MBT0893453.1 ATP synthase subunit I [Geobacter hydrogenophilus]GLI37853.1 ATP synthase subunit I [Geobacter hydrogenophilus]
MGRTISEDRLIATVTIGGLVLLAVLCLTGYVFWSGRFAAGILAGGILALFNFYWMRKTLKRVLNLHPRQAGSFAQFRYLLRFAFVALILYVLIVHAGIDIIGLILGLSIFVVVIIGLSIYMLLDKGE